MPIAVETLGKGVDLDIETPSGVTMGGEGAYEEFMRLLRFAQLVWERVWRSPAVVVYVSGRPPLEIEEDFGISSWGVLQGQVRLDVENPLTVQMGPKRSWPIAARIVSWSRPEPAPILPVGE